jgi:hypothetical protein
VDCRAQIVLHATFSGRFDVQPELVETMVRLQERSHSVFWEFIRANQAAMEAFYAGDLAACEALTERCRVLGETLGEEGGSGIYAFDLPIDAMWSTVMVLLIESYVALGDLEACTVLRERFVRLAGVNVTTGSGLLCFGRADRYLGMLSFVLGELDVAEEYIGVALEADTAGDSPLWSKESRLWLSRVRRAQGHSAEADAMAAVVEREAAAAGFARLERLASTERSR